MVSVVVAAAPVDLGTSSAKACNRQLQGLVGRWIGQKGSTTWKPTSRKASLKSILHLSPWSALKKDSRLRSSVRMPIKHDAMEEIWYCNNRSIYLSIQRPVVEYRSNDGRETGANAEPEECKESSRLLLLSKFSLALFVTCTVCTVINPSFDLVLRGLSHGDAQLQPELCHHRNDPHQLVADSLSLSSYRSFHAHGQIQQQ